MTSTDKPKPDWNKRIAQELQRVRFENRHNPVIHKMEEANFINNIGLARHAGNQDASNPFLRLDAETEDNLLRTLRDHAKFFLGANDISGLAVGFAGLMQHQKYEDPDLYTHVTDQTAAFLDLCLVTEPSEEEWTNATRDEHIAHLDMLVCAADYITHNRNRFLSPSVTEYKPWGSNIVTDIRNALYLPGQDSGDQDTVGEYINGRIAIACYKNYDGTADRYKASIITAHEFAHLTSDRWRDNDIDTVGIDSSSLRKLYTRHSGMKAMFDMNARFIGSEQSRQAAKMLYRAQAEEVLAFGIEEIIEENYADHVLPAKRVQALRKELSDEPAFSPLIQMIDAHLLKNRRFEKLERYAAEQSGRAPSKPQPVG